MFTVTITLPFNKDGFSNTEVIRDFETREKALKTLCKKLERLKPRTRERAKCSITDTATGITVYGINATMLVRGGLSGYLREENKEAVYG